MKNSCPDFKEYRSTIRQKIFIGAFFISLVSWVWGIKWYACRHWPWGAVLFIPLLWGVQSIAGFFLAPHNCRTGKHVYVSRLLFIQKKKMQENVWEVHGGQLYDFWLMRKHDAQFDTRRVLHLYIRGLRSLPKLLEAGVIQPDTKIEMTTYFFKRRHEVILARWGFQKEAVFGNEYLKFALMYTDIVLKHLLARGGRPLPRVWRLQKYVTTFGRLAANLSADH